MDCESGGCFVVAGKNKDNMTVSYEYDGAGRLKKESDPAWNTISYTFDRFGNRDTMTVSGAETYKTSYHYDPNNRLVLEEKAEADAAEQSRYSYDQNGNQLEKIWERTAKSKPDAKPGSVHFCMDGPKNQKAVYERRQYNTLNQLTHLYRDGEITIYSYRPDGLRHAKQTGRQSRPTATHRLTVHHYDGGNIVSERGENGNRKGLYLRGVNLICQTVDANSYYYLYNAHGDTTSRIDQNGNKSPEYIYDAFGNQRDLIGTDPNPFRYCGEYYDAESGNYYLRARYYDPATGRFGAEDIVRDGLNWYTYCGNNPVGFVDPSGNSWKSVATNAKDGFINYFKNQWDAITHPLVTLKAIWQDMNAPKSFEEKIYMGLGPTFGADAKFIKTGIESIISGDFDQFAYATGERVAMIAETLAIAGISKGVDKVASKVKAAKSAGKYTDFAKSATKNASSSEVVLGKYNQDGISYVQVAEARGSTYFQLDAWDDAAKTIGSNNMWNINEQFLQQQITQGKSFVLTHNPYQATGYFAQEVDFLTQHGYRFVQNGSIWDVIKKSR